MLAEEEYIEIDIQAGRGFKLGLSTVQKHNAMNKQQKNAPYPNFFCSCRLKLLASIESYIIFSLQLLVYIIRTTLILRTRNAN